MAHVWHIQYVFNDMKANKKSRWMQMRLNLRQRKDYSAFFVCDNDHCKDWVIDYRSLISRFIPTYECGLKQVKFISVQHKLKYLTVMSWYYIIVMQAIWKGFLVFKSIINVLLVSVSWQKLPLKGGHKMKCDLYYVLQCRPLNINIKPLIILPSNKVQA